MADIDLEVVRFALALHLAIDPARIDAEHRLEADLGLDALDLVLVVLRLEEIEEAEFPVADLDSVRTVADLVAVVREWSRFDRSTTLPPPPPATSDVVPARRASGIERAERAEDAEHGVHAVIRLGRAANG